MPTSSIDWAAVRAAAAFRLAMPRTPVGGRVGERLGSGTGSSLEFQDYRPYVPGDDLRHVDWAAYARSELLAVRLYREEVAPRIDLVLGCHLGLKNPPAELVIGASPHALRPIGRDTCLEVAVLRGRAGEIRELADRASTERRVRLVQ